MALQAAPISRSDDFSFNLQSECAEHLDSQTFCTSSGAWWDALQPTSRSDGEVTKQTWAIQTARGF